MKINIDTKKGAEAVSDFLQKTSDISKKTIADVQASAVALSEKSKQDSYLRRLKKYNPLFPDVYQSTEFNIPNMIMIRDDAERRGIDVCEGAIGWLGKEGGMEVLYLYDEAVPFSKIQFVPTADCNAIYYVDRFDRNRFVRTDCIFKLAYDERFAELEHIAYSLGAKRCTIDIVEKEKKSQKTKRKFEVSKKIDAPVTDESPAIKAETTEVYNRDYILTQKNENEGHCELTWTGSDKPKRPKLKWFAHDKGICGLIEMRCKGGNSVKTRTIRISGSTSATMSKDTALRIDSAIGSIDNSLGKAKGKAHSELEKQVTKETCSEFVFNIEF